jgi:hypothetical protein
MSYALRRLRWHGLSERSAHPHRYRLTLWGMGTALLDARVHQRLLRPARSHLHDATLADSSPRAAAAQRLQAALDGFITQQIVA